MLLIFSLVIVGIQVLYLILLLTAFYRRRKLPATDLAPVSIIVCAHDEEHNLIQLIPLLLKQNYPDFELIIVEDRSNDGTYDYLLQATKDHPQLKMVRVVNKPEHINGKKFALTLGIKAARHEWVLLTDADCRPASENWIREMAAHFTDKTQIVLGYSPYEKRPGLLNSFIRFESLITGIQFIGLALLGKPYMGVGRNLAYRKSLFLNNKGFSTILGLTGGDDDLFVNAHTNRANTEVALGKDSLTFSVPKESWNDFFRQKHRHLMAGKRYKLSDKIILGLFGITWIFSWMLALPSIFVVSMKYWLIVVLFLRLLLLTMTVKSAAKRLGTDFEWWKVLFLDFFYAFYYLVAGLRALVVKKVRWKT